MSMIHEHDAEIDIGPDLQPEGDMVVTLQLGESGLDQYLSLVGEQSPPRIKCLDGSLTLVSPSHKHERGGDRLDDFVKAVCDVLDISCRSARSTLLRPAGLTNTGIEPDSCYYIEHEPESRNPGDQLDLSQMPPPDLLIEVVVSHGPKKALEICRLLGIPEVWVHRPRSARLQFFHLDEGKYVSKTRSRSFPFLGPEDVIPWLTSPEDEPDNRWRRRLRDWVRDVLAPRRAAGG